MQIMSTARTVQENEKISMEKVTGPMRVDTDTHTHTHTHTQNENPFRCLKKFTKIWVTLNLDSLTTVTL